MKSLPYYSKYDEHYRALYAQGIRYWSDGPDHSKANVDRVASRIIEARPCPEGVSILEIGCGEGHLAVPLVKLRMKYTGIDYSPHAIARARERAAEHGLGIRFVVTDVLMPGEEITGRKYDLVLDQACLQMFVLDVDRKRYLAIVKKLMGIDSKFILTNQARDEQAYEGAIASVGQFEAAFGVDLSKPRAWEAWSGEEWVPVELPAFAARPKSRQGYVEEFANAGFQIDRIYETGSKRQYLDFILSIHD